MAKAVYQCTFKLKKGADVEAFLDAAQKLNDGYISRQKGYVSWQQLNDGDTWMDICTFESMEDVMTFLDNAQNPDELALAFYAFINLNSCVSRQYTIARSYGK